MKGLHCLSLVNDREPVCGIGQRCLNRGHTMETKSFRNKRVNVDRLYKIDSEQACRTLKGTVAKQLVCFFVFLINVK